MRNSFLLAAASVLALTASGAAFAQSAPTTMGSPYYNTTAAPPSATGTYLAIEGPAYVGHTIVNSNGQVVGRILELRGNDYYVSADPSLSVGQRVYIWPRDRLVFNGSGQALVISTPMAREQIVALPVYQMTAAEIKHEGPPPPNGLAGNIPVQPNLGPLPQSLVGKNIYSPRNDVVGHITGIRDDKMLVSVGSFLGMGERIVLFPREWATFTGSGANMTVGTLADMKQISSLPIVGGVVNEAPNQTKK